MILFVIALLLAPAVDSCAVSPEQLNHEGLELLQQDNPVAASEKFRQAQQLLPDNQQLRQNLASAYLASGMGALKKHDYENALGFFRAGSKFSSADFLFSYYIGYAHLLKGEFSQAEVALNGSLGMAPGQAEIHRLLGQLYYDSGRMPEALTSLEKALELQPENLSIANLLDKVRREYAVEGGMESDHGGHFIVSYDGNDHPFVGNEVLGTLEDAYVEVGTWLNSFPEIRTPVLIYNRKAFSALTGTPDWVGGIYDGKIRIPLGGVKEVSAPLRSLLFHEYGHVVIKHLSRGQAPTWLHEGLAEIFAHSQYKRPLRFFPLALKDNQLLNFSNLEGALTNLTPDEVQLAYEQSYHFTAYLVESFGWHVIRELLFAYGNGAGTEGAFSQAFGGYSLGLDALQVQWQRLARLEL